MKNKKTILIQARLSSSRFPKKMLSNLADMTLVEYVYHRCKTSKNIDDVVIITSNEASDDDLFNLCIKKNIKVFRGDLDNVLKRYIDAADYFNTNIICRVCGDSPFIDIEAIDKMINMFNNDKNLEYITTIKSLNGFMSEVFTLDLLKKVYNYDISKEDKEHVTKYVRDNIFKFNTKELSINLKPKELEKFTLTIDYHDDLVIAKKIVKNLDSFDFTSDNILNILKQMKDDI